MFFPFYDPRREDSRTKGRGAGFFPRGVRAGALLLERQSARGTVSGVR